MRCTYQLKTTSHPLNTEHESHYLHKSETLPRLNYLEQGQKRSNSDSSNSQSESTDEKNYRENGIHFSGKQIYDRTKYKDRDNNQSRNRYPSRKHNDLFFNCENPRYYQY